MYIETICLKSEHLCREKTRCRQSEVGKKVEIAGFEKPAKAERNF